MVFSACLKAERNFRPFLCTEMSSESDSHDAATITIPNHLLRRIEERIRGTGFASVSDYATYILSQSLGQEERAKSEDSSSEDEERVKARLKALGYI